VFGVLLAQATQGVGKGITMLQPALSTLDKTVIGALLILSWSLSLLAVWKLLKVQDKISDVQNMRVADQQAMNVRMESLMEKMITTFSKMENALTNLTQAEKDGQALLQAMKNSQETIILEAVRRRAGG